MSAATALALERTQQRNYSRHPINVPVDLIALRFGVPENLPGRCTDISEVGVGAVVAGEMAAGQQVAVELRLPNIGVPMRARAVVRYQSRLRCGLEFVGLSAEQRSMVRYWVRYAASQSAIVPASLNEEAPQTEDPIIVAEPATKPKRRIRIGRRGLFVLMAAVLAVAGLGWWQWQRSWNELEERAPVGKEGLRVTPETLVSSETMEKRIVTKVEPAYPEAARIAGTEGVTVLDAVIAPDGSVKRLRPVSGPDLLAQSAMDAVQSWKFEPYVDQSSGKAVEVETTIAVEFRLH
jgi:TonB family protein